MIRIYLVITILWISFSMSSCQSKHETLKKKIDSIFQKQPGTFALAFHNIATGEEILINEHESFHAASTMKVPVMIEVFKQVAEGKLSLADSVLITNEFKSLADGSLYSLKPEDDSKPDLYELVGKKMKLSDLVYFMITVSSNLATNIIIDIVDAKKVMETMRSLGTKDMLVLRGVEDSKAYALGMNNTTNAYDLNVILLKIATGKAVSEEASAAMLNILVDQKFTSIIPAKLPIGTRIAHKTGWFKSLSHDAGIVYLPNGGSYVVVLLSKSLPNDAAGEDAMATVSKMIYQYVVEN